MAYYFYHFDYPAGSVEPKTLPTATLINQLPTATQLTRAEQLEILHNKLINKKAEKERRISRAPAGPHNSLLDHVKVFAMAAKYQVDGLRHLAAFKFRHEITDGEAWKADDFFQTISLIYSSTPDEVKELRVSAEEPLHAHFAELKHKQGIEEVTCNHPSLLTRARCRWAMATAGLDANRDSLCGKSRCQIETGARVIV
jgi:hypothetical protein